VKFAAQLPHIGVRHGANALTFRDYSGRVFIFSPPSLAGFFYREK